MFLLYNYPHSLKSKVRAVKIDNFGCLFVIRRINKIKNTDVRKVCAIKKSIDRPEKKKLKWYGHVGHMTDDRLAKKGI